MRVAFTLAIYLIAGIAIAIWLAGRSRLPQGIATRIAAVLFWPAYLPICLAPAASGVTEDAMMLHRQIDRLPIDESRKREYQRAIERLATAVDAKQRELSRLAQAEQRLGHLDASIGATVRQARERITAELGRAREGILKLALRLELIDLSHGDLHGELAALEEEFDLLVGSRLEVDEVTSVT